MEMSKIPPPVSHRLSPFSPFVAAAPFFGTENGPGHGSGSR
jgi:hypothetical protein